jgi:hypothetical protein
LTPDQEGFVRQAIKDGRVGSTEDAVQEALQLGRNASAVELKFSLRWMRLRSLSAAAKDW